MKIFNSNKESHWNPIAEFLMLLAFIGFVFGSIMSAFTIARAPISIVNVAISLFMVYVTLRLLDNNRIAMYVFFAYLLIQVIMSYTIPQTATQYWIVTFVLYAISFCLPKDGKTTWVIIHNSPQNVTMDAKDKKLFYVICMISALSAAIGYIV